MRRGVLLPLLGIMLMIRATLCAGVFASGIHFTNPDSSAFDGNVTDGTGLRINFTLSDSASAVVVRLQNSVSNVVIQTINLTNLVPGWNNTIWNGAGAPAGSASYYATVVATRAPRSNTTYKLARVVFSALTSPPFAIFSRGVDIVRDQTNPNFGYIYTSNAGGAIGRGIARYTAAAIAAGTALPNPFLTQSAANTSGVSWTADASAPIHSTVDYLGRVYAADFTAGQVWRMDNNTAVPKRIVSSLTEPKGIATTGTGANLRLYICAGGTVMRANIGTSDTVSTLLTTIASVGGTVRDVIFDDEGFMYVNVRSGTGFEGTAGGITYKFNITGTLPVSEFDAIWTVAWTGFPIGLGQWSGTNTTSASDDIIYVSHRSQTTADPPGIYRLTGLGNITPTREHLFRPADVPNGGGGDCSSRADLTVDPTGNVVWFENGNEEIIFLEQPSSQPTVSYTTRSAVLFTLGTASVEQIDSRAPDRFRLDQNYPNPFNPTTTITFALPQKVEETLHATSLRVYDLLGKEVATLVDESLPAGSYKVTLNAGNLPSGTYFYVLRSGGFTQARKLMVVK